MISARDYLQGVERFFTEHELSCALAEASEELPYERLLVFLGKDYREREQIVEITAQEQEVGQNINDSSLKERYVRAQFQATFPFSFKDAVFRDLASLVFFLNRFIEFPGFEISEEDNRLFYRYVLLASAKESHFSLALAAAGAISMLLDLFTETIEQIAQGKTSFSELLENVLEIRKQAEEKGLQFPTD